MLVRRILSHVFGQPVELVGLSLVLIVTVALDQIHEDVDQLLAARWVQARLEPRVQGHGTVAGTFVHLLHNLECAEGAALVRHEKTISDHCTVKVLAVLDESA